MKRPPLTPELRRRLELAFESDVALTGNLLGRDLTALWFERPRAVPSGTTEPVASR